MSDAFSQIKIAGGDTAQPLAMAKRFKVIRRHLRAAGGRFLDCGCGRGSYVLGLVEQLGLDAHGIEFLEDKLRDAWSNPVLRQRVTRGDAQALNFPDNTWDYAMLNEVLEHVPDDRKALSEVYRVLKPGGILFVFSPNRWFPFESHGVRLRKTGRAVFWIPFIPYIPLRWGNRIFDYWARNYWPSELVKMARASGFGVLERSFIYQTFEGISGSQPLPIRLARPLLRRISNTLEKTPFFRRFGVSQVLVCRK